MGRTERVLQSMVAGVDERGLSFQSLKDVTTSFLELDQEVVNVILNYKKDVWASDSLFELVKDYFDNSMATLDFCEELNKCIKQARENQMSIQVAINMMPSEGDPNEEQCQAILKELNQYVDAGNPFTDEFMEKFQTVYQKQMELQRKLQAKKKSLDRKLRYVRGWTKVSTIIYAATCAALVICAVVAAVMTVPAIVGAVAAVSSMPLEKMDQVLPHQVREGAPGTPGSDERSELQDVCDDQGDGHDTSAHQQPQELHGIDRPLHTVWAEARGRLWHASGGGAAQEPAERIHPGSGRTGGARRSLQQGHPEGQIGGSSPDRQEEIQELVRIGGQLSRLARMIVRTLNARPRGGIAGHRHCSTGSAGNKVSTSILPSRLKACTSSGDIKAGRILHAWAKSSGDDANIHVATALVNLYCKSGCLAEARSVFEAMQAKSTVASTALMLGYIEGDQSDVELDIRLLL
ncbi:hypothetical protein SELMODRAFT_423223 [Selaginella moellendorffii]|uniref:Uncharacterized protein n=1 Tax=Selaginella moellendorffii TaxID=88036 RepID=D8SKZ3_SELML|nr:hypothetical protein SELMODRAFT_423223 [Selaginella moellendorffii]